MSHQYEYEPLQPNQIRLLSLLPGVPSEKLRCILRNVDLINTDDHQRICTYGRSSGDASMNRNSDEWTNVDEDAESEEPIDAKQSYQTPSYNALSYVWGPQHPSHLLRIEGDNSGNLNIGPNLHAALIRLRPLPNQGLSSLWVDQICVNQQDLEERAAQVQRMRDVFKAASMVHIWLGEEDEYTALGTRFAQLLYDVLGDYGDRN